MGQIRSMRPVVYANGDSAMGQSSALPVRYQGAVIRDDKILLIRHTEHVSGRSYWVFPGGGREANETEIECVVREMLEETNLEVSVERLLVESTFSR